MRIWAPWGQHAWGLCKTKDQLCGFTGDSWEGPGSLGLVSLLRKWTLFHMPQYFLSRRYRAAGRSVRASVCLLRLSSSFGAMCSIGSERKMEAASCPHTLVPLPRSSAGGGRAWICRMRLEGRRVENWSEGGRWAGNSQRMRESLENKKSKKLKSRTDKEMTKFHFTKDLILLYCCSIWSVFRGLCCARTASSSVGC